MSTALLRFTDNDTLSPADVYGGPSGAVAQLQRLEAWFQVRSYLCTLFM